MKSYCELQEHFFSTEKTVVIISKSPSYQTFGYPFLSVVSVCCTHYDCFTKITLEPMEESRLAKVTLEPMEEDAEKWKTLKFFTPVFDICMAENHKITSALYKETKNKV